MLFSNAPTVVPTTIARPVTSPIRTRAKPFWRILTVPSDKKPEPPPKK